MVVHVMHHTICSMETFSLLHFIILGNTKLGNKVTGKAACLSEWRIIPINFYEIWTLEDNFDPHDSYQNIEYNVHTLI